MPRCHRESERRLFETAEAQEGFFTTKEAKAAGFASTLPPARETIPPSEFTLIETKHVGGCSSAGLSCEDPFLP